MATERSTGSSHRVTGITTTTPQSAELAYRLMLKACTFYLAARDLYSLAHYWEARVSPSRRALMELLGMMPESPSSDSRLSSESGTS